jgi:DnaJ-class molecular chaperone
MLLKEKERKNMYKEICPDCKGNGYIKHNGLYEETIVQCETCKSEGELKYAQSEVDNFIYNTYFRKRV